jgi:histidine triad (HIT) family protein
MGDDCVFCRLVSGELPAEVLFREDGIVAFRDNRPQAPSHVLVVPETHIESLLELDDPELGGRLLLACRRAAELESLVDGFRVVANVGEHAGRVPHLHFHVLGGRRLSWPPG